jgi:hypothetical protein
MSTPDFAGYEAIKKRIRLLQMEITELQVSLAITALNHFGGVNISQHSACAEKIGDAIDFENKEGK